MITMSMCITLNITIAISSTSVFAIIIIATTISTIIIIIMTGSRCSRRATRTRRIRSRRSATWPARHTIMYYNITSYTIA